MLSFDEKRVLLAVRKNCQNKGACLIEPNDLLSQTEDIGLTEKSLVVILKALSYEGYLELIYTERVGKPLYCITLREKGLNYDREVKNLKRQLAFKVLITVSLAFISFLTGIILKAIFC